MADSEAGLARAIASARAAGLQPQTIAVSASRRTYRFPVYANVTRSDRALFVVAYNALYVFRLNARVHYVDADIFDSEVPIARLPRVRAPGFEVARAHEPGAAARCPDCIAVVTQKSRIAALTQSWPSQTDPWQLSPNYTAWVPIPKHPATPHP